MTEYPVAPWLEWWILVSQVHFLFKRLMGYKYRAGLISSKFRYLHYHSSFQAFCERHQWVLLENYFSDTFRNELIILQKHLKISTDWKKCAGSLLQVMSNISLFKFRLVKTLLKYSQTPLVLCPEHMHEGVKQVNPEGSARVVCCIICVQRLHSAGAEAQPHGQSGGSWAAALPVWDHLENCCQHQQGR